MTSSCSCRLCLSELNSTSEDTEKDYCPIDCRLKLLISFCVGIKVEDVTYLPSNICLRCKTKLYEFHKFKKKSQRSEVRLKETLAQNNCEDVFDETDDQNIDSVDDECKSYKVRRCSETSLLVSKIVKSSNAESEETEQGVGEKSDADLNEESRNPDICDPTSTEENNGGDNTLADAEGELDIDNRNDESQSSLFEDEDDALSQYSIVIENEEQLVKECNSRIYTVLVKKLEDTQYASILEALMKYESERKMRQLILNSKKYECGYCGECFSRQVTLEAHVEKHERDQQLLYKCVECYEMFHTHNQLLKHKAEAHDEDPYYCSFCSESSADLFSWTNHMNSNHVSCDKCRSYFKDKEGFDNHACLGSQATEVDTNRIVYKCPDSVAKSRSKKIKPKRKRGRPPNEEKIKKLKLDLTPNGENANKDAVPPQVKIAEAVKKLNLFSCIQCCKFFISKDSLICHQAVAHAGLVLCKHCLTFFDTQNQLDAHTCPFERLSYSEVSSGSPKTGRQLKDIQPKTSLDTSEEVDPTAATDSNEVPSESAPNALQPLSSATSETEPISAMPNPHHLVEKILQSVEAQQGEKSQNSQSPTLPIINPNITVTALKNLSKPLSPILRNLNLPAGVSIERKISSVAKVNPNNQNSTIGVKPNSFTLNIPSGIKLSNNVTLTPPLNTHNSATPPTIKPDPDAPIERPPILGPNSRVPQRPLVQDPRSVQLNIPNPTLNMPHPSRSNFPGATNQHKHHPPSQAKPFIPPELLAKREAQKRMQSSANWPYNQQQSIPFFARPGMTFSSQARPDGSNIIHPKDRNQPFPHPMGMRNPNSPIHQRHLHQGQSFLNKERHLEQMLPFQNHPNSTALSYAAKQHHEAPISFPPNMERALEQKLLQSQLRQNSLFHNPMRMNHQQYPNKMEASFQEKIRNLEQNMAFQNHARLGNPGIPFQNKERLLEQHLMNANKNRAMEQSLINQSHSANQNMHFQNRETEMQFGHQAMVSGASFSNKDRTQTSKGLPQDASYPHLNRQFNQNTNQFPSYPNSATGEPQRKPPVWCKPEPDFPEPQVKEKPFIKREPGELIEDEEEEEQQVVVKREPGEYIESKPVDFNTMNPSVLADFGLRQDTSL